MEGALAVKALMAAVLVALCGAVPVASPSQEELAEAQEYLSRFFSDVGVSAPGSVWRSSLDSFEDTLRKMQEFYGLKVTGQLDTDTMDVMKRPRCGFTDVSAYSHFDGRPKWKKSLITYRITNYTPDLSQGEVDAVIAKALNVHSKVVPLDFKKIDSGTADIMITFKSDEHGDFAPFDGQGGVLAHAFSPGAGIGGDTHFDEDETWSLTAREANLFLVAAHEFGHALGLAHSRLQTALMYPTYQYVNTEGYKLSDDDVQGLQALYGVRETSVQPEPGPGPAPPEAGPGPVPPEAGPGPVPPVPGPGPVPPVPGPGPVPPEPGPGPVKPETGPGPIPPEPGPGPVKPETGPGPIPQPTIKPLPDPQPTPEPDPDPTPDWCSRAIMFDAATTIQGKVYFFKDGHYWKRSSSWDGIDVQSIQSTWPGISRVDAAYEFKRDDAVTFFEGNRYWKIQGNTVLPGYPKSIRALGLPPYVNKVDAAVHVRFTGKTLIFANRKYWSYNERRGRMDFGYPKYIKTELPGVGHPVEAAFENKGFMYLSVGFRQVEYYYPRRRVNRRFLNSAWLDCE